MRPFLLGLRDLLWRCRADEELDEELGQYLESAIEQKMARGLTREAATRAARVEMGSIAAARDSVRDAGWESRLDNVWRDVRFAARSLRRSPAFTAVAVITLALGIGANTAIFSVVNGLMLGRLPVHRPNELMLVSSAGADTQGWPAGWPYVIWEQLRAHADTFDGAIAWSGVGTPIRFDLSPHGERHMVAGLYVDGSFFSTLGVSPELGRVFPEGDDEPGGGPDGPVAVISYEFWQRRFNGDLDVVGTPLTLDGLTFTIAGVSPPGFFGMDVGRTFDVAVPIAAIASTRSKEDWTSPGGPAFLNVAIRLKDGQSPDAATAILRGIQSQVFDGAIPPQPGQGDDPYRAQFLSDPFTLIPAATGISDVRGMYANPLLVMLTVVSLVLLIACTNIATLLIARGAARAHEIDVRLALGAPRWRLASHVLAEGGILGAAGALLGLLLAAWAAPALAARLTAFGVSSELRTPLDWSVLAFTSTITFLTVMVFGGFPALRAIRLSGAMAGARQTPRHMRPARFSRAPLVFQMALTLVLLVAAGLFIWTFERLSSRPPGFDSDRVLVISVDASRSLVPEGHGMPHYQRLVEAVAAVPGVARAAASEFTPVHFGTVRVSAIDIPGVRPEDRRPLPTYAITPGWFATYGSVLRAGRDFAAGDTASAPLVAVVNESLARLLFGNGDPIGRTIAGRFGPADEDARHITVVGIVADAILGSLWDVIPPTMYVPLGQASSWGSLPGEISISVRSASGSPAALSPAIAAALTAADTSLSFSFQLLSEAVDATIAWERLRAVIAGFFGALGLTLAAAGVYGATAYAAARRRAEVGLRVALGATKGQVIRLVLRNSLSTALLGTMIGVASAAAVTRYLERMLFGITPLDALTFVVSPALFIVITLLAALVPARHAANADPLAALRCDS